MHVISGDVWSDMEVKEAMKSHETRYYCIAYVTKLPRGMFRKGDVLICDASQKAVSSGETDPKVLLRLLARGVKLYSCEALHAKCAVWGKWVLLGSANLSESSAERLRELAVLQKNDSLAIQVNQFINELIEDDKANLLNEDTLRRLKKFWRSQSTPWQRQLSRRKENPLKVMKGSHKGTYYLVDTIWPAERKESVEKLAEKHEKEAVDTAKRMQILRRGQIIDDFHTTDKTTGQRYKLGDQMVTIEYVTENEDSRALVYGPCVVVKVVKKGKDYLVYYSSPKNGVPYGKVKSDREVRNAVRKLGQSVHRKVDADQFDVLVKAIKRIGKGR